MAIQNELIMNLLYLEFQAFFYTEGNTTYYVNLINLIELNLLESVRYKFG